MQVLKDFSAKNINISWLTLFPFPRGGITEEIPTESVTSISYLMDMRSCSRASANATKNVPMMAPARYLRLDGSGG